MVHLTGTDNIPCSCRFFTAHVCLELSILLPCLGLLCANLFTIKDAVFNQGKTIGPIGGGNCRLIMHVTSNKTRGYSAVGTEHYANVRTTEDNACECSVIPRMISELISNKQAMQ